MDTEKYFHGMTASLSQISDMLFEDELNVINEGPEGTSLLYSSSNTDDQYGNHPAIQTDYLVVVIPWQALGSISLIKGSSSMTLVFVKYTAWKEDL
eukprot:scaffold96_cov167-Ochromonas_danica.AAC.45